MNGVAALLQIPEALPAQVQIAFGVDLLEEIVGQIIDEIDAFAR